jgi:hypothetical protein
MTMRGWATLESGAHVALSPDECEAIVRSADAAKERRHAEMPDEQSAIRHMFDGWLRLKDFGWQEAIYCPKDGTVFDAIEAGSTGIHDCHYQGEWPGGSWWIHGDGDLWPSRPILFRLKSESMGTKTGTKRGSP